MVSFRSPQIKLLLNTRGKKSWQHDTNSLPTSLSLDILQTTDKEIIPLLGNKNTTQQRINTGVTSPVWEWMMNSVPYLICEVPHLKPSWGFHRIYWKMLGHCQDMLILPQLRKQFTSKKKSRNERGKKQFGRNVKSQSWKCSNALKWRWWWMKLCEWMSRSVMWKWNSEQLECLWMGSNRHPWTWALIYK